MVTCVSSLDILELSELEAKMADTTADLGTIWVVGQRRQTGGTFPTNGSGGGAGDDGGIHQNEVSMEDPDPPSQIDPAPTRRRRWSVMRMQRRRKPSVNSSAKPPSVAMMACSVGNGTRSSMRTRQVESIWVP